MVAIYNIFVTRNETLFVALHSKRKPRQMKSSCKQTEKRNYSFFRSLTESNRRDLGTLNRFLQIRGYRRCKTAKGRDGLAWAAHFPENDALSSG